MKHSLEWRLSVVLALLIVIGGALAATLSFWLAYQEADEQQDSQLIQLASLVADGVLGYGPSNPVTRIDEDVETRVVVIPLGVTKPGTRVSMQGLTLDADVHEGMHTVISDGVDWRVYVTQSNGARFALAQRTVVRDEVAIGSATRTLVPLMVLIPALAVIVRLVLRRTFAALTAAARDLDTADELTRTPVRVADLPAEVRPFGEAINRLAARLGTALLENRRFVGEAAHELRSPVAALMVQGENLGHANMSLDARARLIPLRQGLIRLSSLLDQLLDLARQNAPAAGGASASVRLDDVIRAAIEAVLPIAQHKGVDLGVVHMEEVVISGSYERVYALARNAIDNAVRYTPPQGVVDVAVWQDADAAYLTVEDSGPGLDDSQLKRVFDPFYRVLGTAQQGSGLGLAIVGRAASALGGAARLVRRPDGARGLRFEYRHPTRHHQ